MCHSSQLQKYLLKSIKKIFDYQLIQKPKTTILAIGFYHLQSVNASECVSCGRKRQILFSHVDAFTNDSCLQNLSYTVHQIISWVHYVLRLQQWQNKKETVFFRISELCVQIFWRAWPNNGRGHPKWSTIIMF